MSQGRVAMHVHSLGEEERGGTKHNPEKCLAEQGCRVGKGGGHSSALGQSCWDGKGRGHSSALGQGCRDGKGGGHTSVLQNRGGVGMERAETTAQHCRTEV